MIVARHGGRLMAIAAIALLLTFAIATDGQAQRRGGGEGRGGGEERGEERRSGGLSAEERAFLRNLSEGEREQIRLMDRDERRAHIRKLMNRPSESSERGGATERGSTADANEGVKTLDGFVPPDLISEEVRVMVGKFRGRRTMDAAVAIQKSRGGIETGLEPAFIGGASCPEIDSEKWAIDYTNKREGAAIHKGIDIPQPRGTPIRAVADGTVVGRFLNDGNRKGIEVMLRHTPEQTGLPFWTYTQYTHLREMSPLPIGAQVKMGQEIGKTSNTGKMGRRIRRDALHFAVLYSRHPEWSNDGRFVIPKDSYWMDPNAFYRAQAPWDSSSLAALPSDGKKVPVPYMKSDGTFVTRDPKRIWPYACD